MPIGQNISHTHISKFSVPKDTVF